MLKKVVLSMVTVGLLFGLTGREVMEKQKELQSTDTEQTKEFMILINEDGSKEVREVSIKKKKNNQKDLSNSLIVFVKPAEVAGTALLNIQPKENVELQYLYLPAQKILQRIAQGSKKNYFMGTDFTYEDLSPDKLDNYHYKIIKEETLKVSKTDKPEECYVIEAIPTDSYKPKTNYGKKVLWITKNHFYTKKVEFYDKKGKFIKDEVSWDFINPTGTVYRPIKVFINNKKENHKTLVKVSDIKVNIPIKDKIFSKRYLVNEEHMIDE
jgi:hypothetical protein